jgi:hypothetical protein
MNTYQTSADRPLRRFHLVIACCLLPAFNSLAADKSQYHLFNPTPRELMRAMSTDRPDLTESAHTVDAGHFQLETDLVNFSHDHDTAGGADTKVDAWTAGAVNLKAGLLNWMDLQLVLDIYNHVTTEDRVGGTKVRQSGLGDFTTRVKMNLWGNDGGTTALAVMPFVKFPTNQDDLGNDEVEGGLIIPFGMELPGGWSLGVMTEFDFVRNNADTGYRTDFVNSLVVGHDLIGKLGGYVEFFSVVSSESGNPWVGVLGLGLAYAVTDDLQLDGGVNLGLTRSAEDINPFLGVSWRF